METLQQLFEKGAPFSLFYFFLLVGFWVLPISRKIPDFSNYG